MPKGGIIEKILTHELKWLNKPKTFSIDSEKIIIKTQNNTDFWQRTYYGFQHDKNLGSLRKKIQHDRLFFMSFRTWFGILTV